MSLLVNEFIEAFAMLLEDAAALNDDAGFATLCVALKIMDRACADRRKAAIQRGLGEIQVAQDWETLSACGVELAKRLATLDDEPIPYKPAFEYGKEGIPTKEQLAAAQDPEPFQMCPHARECHSYSTNRPRCDKEPEYILACTIYRDHYTRCEFADNNKCEWQSVNTAQCAYKEECPHYERIKAIWTKMEKHEEETKRESEV